MCITLKWYVLTLESSPCFAGGPSASSSPPWLYLECQPWKDFTACLPCR